MINRKEMPKITEEQKRILDEGFEIDKEKLSMMNRKERREFSREHKKDKKRLKF